MPTCSYVVTATAKATRQDVFDLVSDTMTWPKWSGIPRARREREGAPAPDGVGSIRRLGYPPVAGSREEVTAYEAPRHMAYKILTGALPVRRYQAEIDLQEQDSGDGPVTTITWSGRFDPLIPGTARVMTAVVRRMITRFATGAARYAAGHPGR